MSTYLTVDQLGCGTDYGVPREWVGEDGDAVAITVDRRRGLAAISAMAHRDIGPMVSTAGLRVGWARFKPGQSGSATDPGEWIGYDCAEGDEGALPVVRVLEVGAP